MSITADNYFTVLHSLEDFLKYESQRLGILGDTGLAPVNAPSIVPSPVNTPPLAALLSPGTANWKGQLCEYHQKRGLPLPEITVAPVGSKTGPPFVASCKIQEHAAPFKDPVLAVRTRIKDAEQAACKLACDWLIEVGRMRPSGMTTPILSPPQSPSTNAVATLGQRMTRMCQSLGIVPPQFFLVNSSPLSPSHWDCTAVLVGAGGLTQRIVVENVLGKEKAKDACRLKVIEYLRKYE